MHRALPGTLQCVDCVRSCVHSRGSRLSLGEPVCLKFRLLRRCRWRRETRDERRETRDERRTETTERDEERTGNRGGKGTGYFSNFPGRRVKNEESRLALLSKRPLGFFSRNGSLDGYDYRALFFVLSLVSLPLISSSGSFKRRILSRSASPPS